AVDAPELEGVGIATVIDHHPRLVDDLAEQVCERIIVDNLVCPDRAFGCKDDDFVSVAVAGEMERPMLKSQLDDFIACLEAAATDMAQDAGVGGKPPYVLI